MTKVVIVGEIYEQNAQVGGGPMPGGGGPVDPGYDRPFRPWSPTDPGYGRPGGPHISTGPIYGGGHPSNRPPGSWGGEYPSGGPIYGGGHPGGGPMPGGERPSNELPELPQGGTDVPEDVYTPAPVPEEIASQYVVTVYDPKTLTYTTKTYPPR